ncbi:biliverdin-producing heme oxygenase [Afifella sp. IM 167]|uniref:biliverdin-producing heme oxygenase n=1 Tax=Afifella sp. IM 167 TaxID=2033586 RepID=UPI001CCD91BF|nr:biliverdin-producing heme oxygenase [Afifella sp. IM 167]MBZ8132703.1 hypothetical protein [Afifella sp. IM 167]
MTIFLRERHEAESFRFVLRRETREQHLALDQHAAFAELQEGVLELGRYRRLMAALHGFYLGFDPAVARACAAYGLERRGFHYAPRAPILAQDLVSLGGSEGIPRAGMAMPAVASQAELAGLLYVSEGSMLGGSMLCAATETMLAEAGASGNAYWRWCREAGAPRWRATCGIVEALSSEEAARAAMIASARAAFRRFAAFLADV